MPRHARSALFSLAAASLALVAAAPASLPIDPGQAQAVFAEAKAISDRDGGRFWGQPLYGPILLVAPESRATVANRADPGGVLTAAGPLFTGRLPEAVNVSNSPTEWSGVRWTQLIWPLYGDEAMQHVSLAHEMYHRIQPTLGLWSESDGDNSHLDTLEGRYGLQLEWRALAAALSAPTAEARRAAILDALVFRAERYRRFPGAAVQEAMLERTEGTAEYTGVRLGLATPAEQTAYALRDLTAHVGDKSFVRSFAYATGPAYGLLLDRPDPDWRHHFPPGQRFDVLLLQDLKLTLPTALEAEARARAARYDQGGVLRTAEVKREEARQARMAALKAKLVDGPILTASLAHMNIQFNPSTLQPLDGYGVVYPSLRITAPWGVIEVSNDALLDKDWKTLTVSAAHLAPGGLAGEGWTLTLNAGWAVVSDARAGDFKVVEKTTAR